MRIYEGEELAIAFVESQVNTSVDTPCANTESSSELMERRVFASSGFFLSCGSPQLELGLLLPNLLD